MGSKLKVYVNPVKPAIKLGSHGPINYIDYHAKGLTKMDHYVGTHEIIRKAGTHCSYLFRI